MFSYLHYLWNRGVRNITIDSPPVFIVGCGHSGTSLLLAILDTHSRIYAVPYESYIASKGGPEVFRKKLMSFDIQAVSAGKHRWVEKTPRHIHHIGDILKWCPEARILLMIRDGRDVACSIQARTGSLEIGIRRWVNDNLAGKEYWSHPNVRLVSYEHLVGEFDPAVGEILHFLGEEYEQSMKDFHKIRREWYSDRIVKPAGVSEKDHNQYRNWQINQPLFDGRGRWRHLSTEDLAMLNRIAGGLLTELGYIGDDHPSGK